jgi:hypothetical protein
VVLSADTSLAATSTVQWYCQQKHVWQPPVLTGFLSADISGSHQYCLALEVVTDTSARKEMDLEIFSF